MIPDDWVRCKLGNLAKIKTGGTPKRMEPHYWGGDIPWMSSGEIHKRYINDTKEFITEDGLKSSNACLLPQETVMIALNGQGRTRGTVAILRTPVTCNQSLAGFIAHNNILNADYLFFYLDSKYQSLRDLSGDNGRNGLNLKLLREIEIDLPSLPEQKKIAAILSSVDDAIQATQAVIDQTRTVKQGLLHELLTLGIGHTRFKQSEIGEIPEEWEVMTVNEIVSLMKSGLSRRIVPQDIGIPVLISGNIQNGKLDTKELKFWYEKDPQGARVGDYILKDGDILLCFINSLKQIGKLCIYEDIGRSAIYTTNLFRIQLKQTYSPNFGYYIFSAPFFQKEIDLITKPAVNQASFTKADFLRILIPIPPKEERDKVVKILESVDYNLETAQIQLRTVQKLKRGLMQDLLTGRVRVKPDEVNTT